jgi:hypothetical protein
MGIKQKTAALCYFSIGLFLAYPAHSQNERPDYRAFDMSKISDAFQRNIIQFENHFKGRTFWGEFTLRSITPIGHGKYRAQLRPTGLFLLGASLAVECVLSERNALNEVSNWGVGNRWTGRLVTTRGRILAVADDTLILYDQSIRAVGGFPEEIARRKDIRCE